MITPAGMRPIYGGTTSYAELKVKGQRFFCLVFFYGDFFYGLLGLKGLNKGCATHILMGIV